MSDEEPMTCPYCEVSPAGRNPGDACDDCAEHGCWHYDYRDGEWCSQCDPDAYGEGDSSGDVIDLGDEVYRLLAEALDETLSVSGGWSGWNTSDGAPTGAAGRRHPLPRPRGGGAAVRRLRAFLLGLREYRSDLTAHFEDYSLLVAYDAGRELAHRLREAGVLS